MPESKRIDAHDGIAAKLKAHFEGKTTNRALELTVRPLEAT
jgi:hypothetical protein